MSKIPLPQVLPYDKKSAESIFKYSKGLLGNTLRDFVWEDYVPKKGKGALGQMVENIYFFLETNSNPASDFSEAGMELKCIMHHDATTSQHTVQGVLLRSTNNHNETNSLTPRIIFSWNHKETNVWKTIHLLTNGGTHAHCRGLSSVLRASAQL